MEIGVTQEKELTDADYRALAAFRHAIRRFQSFSEGQAAQAGLTPQQHQALLAIRAATPEQATVGYVAERLILKPHSATGLVDRLVALGLVVREAAAADRRRVYLRLTPGAYAMLAALTAIHREEVQKLRPVLLDILGQLA
ncbi:MarR family winged helix-turn-helix transcriptional regulator [Sphingobium baderi]|uniref:MarR family transcriptional regulator n=2 Tax=Sphingobium TaxID=165695 RepID=A0A0S3F4B0_9SPHN|nr:helix-turn-helix domain-containing protein [Sphingobium baderi]ALR22528.1 MarR family transcriptional regulator [Sphingobium baderi]